MSYIRSKMVNGYGPYYEEVRGVREGKKVKQIFVRYIGTSPDAGSTRSPPKGPSENVVPKSPEPKGYLEVEGSPERKELKTWDRQRYNRAKMIAEATDSTMFQADGLAKQAWRMGRDPSTVDWDAIQGKDLSYEEKQRKLAGMGFETASKRSLLTEDDYEAEAETWNEQQAEREAYRIREYAGADI
jgi:hypothetical protein